MCGRSTPGVYGTWWVETREEQRGVLRRGGGDRGRVKRYTFS